MNILKPKILKPGDTIGIISPSAPLAGLIPHRTNHAIEVLKNMGFKVRIGKNIWNGQRKSRGY